jgi:hypothetical protein
VLEDPGGGVVVIPVRQTQDRQAPERQVAT